MGPSGSRTLEELITARRQTHFQKPTRSSQSHQHPDRQPFVPFLASPFDKRQCMPPQRGHKSPEIEVRSRLGDDSPLRIRRHEETSRLGQSVCGCAHKLRCRGFRRSKAPFLQPELLAHTNIALSRHVYRPDVLIADSLVAFALFMVRPSQLRHVQANRTYRQTVDHRRPDRLRRPLRQWLRTAAQWPLGAISDDKGIHADVAYTEVGT